MSFKKKDAIAFWGMCSGYILLIIWMAYLNS